MNMVYGIYYVVSSLICYDVTVQWGLCMLVIRYCVGAWLVEDVYSSLCNTLYDPQKNCLLLDVDKAQDLALLFARIANSQASIRSLKEYSCQY